VQTTQTQTINTRRNNMSTHSENIADGTSFTAAEVLALQDKGPFLSAREYLLEHHPEDISLAHALAHALENAPFGASAARREPMQPTRWDLVNLSMTLCVVKEAA
jgi:hypothetical protein